MVTITDESTGVSAAVRPEYGGMLTGLFLPDGRNVLRLDESVLPAAPMCAGGMPILFPFAGKTRDDTWHLDGAAYHMPFHGLVKNDAFAVREQTASSVTVWIGANVAQHESCYPFDYRLELDYRLDSGVLEAVAAIANLSEQPMPHSFGWHPYFLATDKSALSFSHAMRGRYDYIACTDGPPPPAMPLSEEWDDVLISPSATSFVLENAADRYRLECEYDDGHQALVVCTTPENSVCIEPWRGIPDSANTGRFLQWIKPGGIARYRLRLAARAWPA